MKPSTADDEIFTSDEIVDLKIDATIHDGTLVFENHDKFIEASRLVSEANEASYQMWADKIGFRSLLAQFKLAETSYYEDGSGVESAQKICSNFRAESDSSSYLQHFSPGEARLLDTDGLVVVDGHVGFISTALQAWDKAENIGSMRKGIDISHPTSQSLGATAFIAYENLGKNDTESREDEQFVFKCGQTEFAIPYVKIQNGSRWHQLNVSFYNVVAPLGGDYFDTYGILRINSSSYKKNSSRKYKTEHSIRVTADWVTVDGSSNDGLSYFRQRDTKDLNAYMELGGKTRSFGSRSAQGARRRITALEEKEASTDVDNRKNWGSFATHRGMGDGNWFVFKCD